MKRTKIIWFTLPAFLAFMYSCTKSADKSTCHVTVKCDIDGSCRINRLSQVCDSVTAIPLQPNEKALLGVIDKIQMDDHHICILSNNKCFIYDSEGHFKNLIDKMGHAKFEYVYIDDICLTSGNIILADAQSKKILVFSQNGKPLEEIKVDFFPERIMAVNDSIVAVSCGGNQGSRLIVYHIKNRKVLQEHFEYDDRFLWPIPQTFVKSAQGVLYKQPYSNIYYSIAPQGNVAKAYCIDFGKYRFSAADLKETDLLGNKILQDSKGNAQILRLLETKHYFCVEFVCTRLSEDGQFIILVNKTTNKCLLLDSETYKDDLLHGNYRVLPDFSESYGESFVGVIDPQLWKESLKKEGTPIKDKNDLKLTSVLQHCDDLTPIICVYHMKQEISAQN